MFDFPIDQGKPLVHCAASRVIDGKYGVREINIGIPAANRAILGGEEEQ